MGSQVTMASVVSKLIGRFLWFTTGSYPRRPDGATVEKNILPISPGRIETPVTSHVETRISTTRSRYDPIALGQNKRKRHTFSNHEKKKFQKGL